MDRKRTCVPEDPVPAKRKMMKAKYPETGSHKADKIIPIDFKTCVFIILPSLLRLLFAGNDMQKYRGREQVCDTFRSVLFTSKWAGSVTSALRILQRPENLNI